MNIILGSGYNYSFPSISPAGEADGAQVSGRPMPCAHFQRQSRVSLPNSELLKPSIDIRMCYASALHKSILSSFQYSIIPKFRLLISIIPSFQFSILPVAERSGAKFLL
jgi:hypothetical protein